MTRPRALDLFCGACGGWSLGLHRAGIPTVAACEIDPWRRAVYGRNNPGVRLYEDVRTLTADRLVRDLGYLPDVIVGSPPCQDFSCANRNAAGLAGERGKLFLEAIRLVDECRPLFAAFENSPRIRDRGGDRLLDELESLGYAVIPTVVEARMVLAPHRRERAWVIAAHADVWRNGPIEARPLRAGRFELGAGEAGQAGAEFPGDADSQGLAQRESKRGDARPELAALERAVGPAGIRWNGGPARHFRVADGVSACLARQCIAAYGDAVIPQITEAIARTMLRLLPERAAA